MADQSSPQEKPRGPRRRHSKSHRFLLACGCAFMLLGPTFPSQGSASSSSISSPVRDLHRENLKTRLESWIREKADEELGKFDRVADGKKISDLEAARDDQLRDVDGLLDQIARAFEKKEVSEDYALANDLLAQSGPAEVLAFLRSKNTERDSRIADLCRAILAREGDVEVNQSQLRLVLREKLLEASLEEKSLHFDQALEQYQAVWWADRQWAEPQDALARLLIQRSEAVEPAKGDDLLDRAMSICRDSLSFGRSREFPQGWAAMQVHFGNATGRRGALHLDGRAREFLHESVDAFQEALKVYTREDFPRKWALAQEGLAQAYYQQGIQSGPLAPFVARRALGEAADAYEEALKVFTWEQWPQDWARVRTALGIALMECGERATGPESVQDLGDALAAFRDVLKVQTRERQPLAWAAVQIHLANACSDQAGRAEAADAEWLRDQAVAAYEEAMRVYTREQFPPDWAKAQHNLGNVRWEQASRAEGTESQRLFGEAAAAYREALKVRTLEQFPKEWADTQFNLGGALLEQGQHAQGVEASRRFAEAARADREALRGYRSPDESPQDWIATQSNLGKALWKQGREAAANGNSEEQQQLFGEAVEAYRDALKVVRARTLFPQDFAAAQDALGQVLCEQAALATGPEASRLLGEAVEAYREALKTYTQEKAPADQKTMRKKLASTLKALAQAVGGEPGEKYTAEATEIEKQLAAAEAGKWPPETPRLRPLFH